MEHLRGVPLTDIEAIRGATEQDPTEVLISALNTWFSTVMGAASFHADVHAGLMSSACFLSTIVPALPLLQGMCLFSMMAEWDLLTSVRCSTTLLPHLCFADAHSTSGNVGRINPVIWYALQTAMVATATKDYDELARALAALGITSSEVDIGVRLSRTLKAFSIESLASNGRHSLQT